MKEWEINNKFSLCVKRAESSTDKINIKLIVETGSENETKEGTTHLLEHLLLSFDLIENDSGKFYEYVRGCTHFEYSTFEIEFENNIANIRRGLLRFKEILDGKYINQEMFDKAKLCVLHEIEHISEEDEKFLSIVKFYAGFGHLPTGTSTSIKNITFKDIQDYFNNIFLKAYKRMIVIGKIDECGIKQLIEEMYSVKINSPYLPKCDVYFKLDRCAVIRQLENIIEIFFPVDPMSFDTIKKRACQDLCLSIIEDILPRLSKELYDNEEKVICHILHLGKQVTLLQIQICLNDYNGRYCSNTDFKTLYGTMLDYVDEELFQDIKNDYLKGLYQDLELSLEVETYELEKYYVFRVVPLNVKEYVNAVQALSIYDILEKMEISIGQYIREIRRIL